MKELAVCLRKQRQYHGYDVRTLVTKSGVTNAQISKIETGKSQISVQALIRLAYGLNIGFQEILWDLQQQFTERKNDSTGPYYIYSAVCAACLRNLQSRGSNLLPDQPIPSPVDLYELLMYSRDRPGDVKHLLLEGTIGLNDESDLISVQENSHTSDGQDFLSSVYQSGGVITLSDLAKSIRAVRELRQKSLRKVAKGQISYSTIGRFERGQMNRLLFTQIMELDALLGYEGLLLASAWEAEEYEAGITINKASPGWDWLGGWNPEEKSIADSFIATCRWHYVQGGDQVWWQRARQLLRAYRV